MRAESPNRTRWGPIRLREEWIAAIQVPGEGESEGFFLARDRTMRDLRWSTRLPAAREGLLCLLRTLISNTVVPDLGASRQRFLRKQGAPAAFFMFRDQKSMLPRTKKKELWSWIGPLSLSQTLRKVGFWPSERKVSFFFGNAELLGLCI